MRQLLIFVTFILSLPAMADPRPYVTLQDDRRLEQHQPTSQPDLNAIHKKLLAL